MRSLVAITAAVGPAVIGAAVLGGVAVNRALDDGPADPTCNERHLAEGTGYGPDIAFAIAASRGVQERHPELSGIVDAVADYEAAHPDYDSLGITELPSDYPRKDWEGMSGEVPMIYLGMLFALVEDPALRTPDLLTAIERVAREDEGIRGVSLMMDSADDLYPHEFNGGEPLLVLKERVDAYEDAIAEAGVVPLPVLCP